MPSRGNQLRRGHVGVNYVLQPVDSSLLLSRERPQCLQREAQREHG